MNNLISINNIDQNNYTESLIKYCYYNGIISLDDRNLIYNKLLELLHYKCIHLKGGLVSTIKVSELKNVHNSIMFTLDLYLKEFDINLGIKLLLNEDIFSLYDEAIIKLKEFVLKTKMFYKVVFLKNMIRIDNYYYNSTLKDGIDCFFKKYNYSYYSDRIIISADYECALERIKLNGILFIDKYLRYINYENIFCRCFDIESIKRMLKKKYVNYKDIVINIFSDVFLVSILLLYCNEEVESLNSDLIDIDSIYNDYKNNCFNDKLLESFNSLKDKYNFNSNVCEYLDIYYFKFCKTILYFVSNRKLEELLGKSEIVII